MKFIRLALIFMLYLISLSITKRIKDEKKSLDRKIKLRHIDEFKGHELTKEQINLIKRKGRKFWTTSTPDPDSDACLITEKELDQKYSPTNYELLVESLATKKKFDLDVGKKRLRFIEKGCSPVLFVPGLLATRLNAVLNCSKINADKAFRLDLDLFCGNKICSTNDVEVHAFWPNANLSGFYMMHDKNNKNNECFGYFMKFYNTNTSCKEGPNAENKCKYSDYVRMVPKGIDKKDANEDSDFMQRSMAFKCGSNAINNILGFSYYLEQTVNKFSTVTQGFLKLEKKLTVMGYEPGFSHISLPYDFREAQCNNLHFNKLFEESINALYANTGRKVIIVAHSYGNLNTHFQLRSNSSIRDKIAHFVSIAPPYTGVTKPNYILGRGSTEFKKDLTVISLDVSRFAQSMFGPYLMSAYTLRKFNYIEALRKYSSASKSTAILADAFANHLEYTTCLSYKKNCDLKEPNLLTEFDEEFSFLKDKSYCESQKINIDVTEFAHSSFVTDENKVTPTKHVCDLTMLDYNNCANIILDNKLSENVQGYLNDTLDSQKSKMFKNLCTTNKNDKGLYFYNKNCDETNDDKIEKSDKLCDREYISNHGLKPKHYTSVVTSDNKQMFGKLEKEYSNLSSDVSNLDKICENSKKILEHPGVPVSVIFGRSIETRAGFVSRSNKEDAEQSKYESLFLGGDGTVEADSSLFVALKWLNEHKKLNKPSVKIFDYCPPVKNDFKTNFYTKMKNLNSKHYTFLKCQCYNYDDGYFKPGNLSSCGHAELLSDDTITNLMRDIIISNITDKTEPIAKSINRIKNKGTHGFLKKCVELYDKQFYEGFNFNLN